MSPARYFTDPDKNDWTAWDVVPAWGERRRGERRQRSAGPPAGLNERRTRERRVTKGIRIALTPKLAGGWIAFESNNERRRIAPIPPGWHELPDEELVALWHAAEVLPARRKRLIE